MRRAPALTVLARPCAPASVRLVAMLSAILLAACQPNLAPVEVQVSKIEPVDTVTLARGESARLQPAGIVVTFVSVLEDSRCPANVTCVWMGNVRVALRASQNAGGVTRFELANNAEPSIASLGTHELRIVAVRPDVRTDQPIAIDLEVRLIAR